MRVRLSFVDGETSEVDVVSLPWEYKTFLVLDHGNDSLTYIPSSSVKSFTAPRT